MLSLSDFGFECSDSPDSLGSSSGQGVTCEKCLVVVGSCFLELRTHSKSDFHNYNVKRSCAELPPLSLEEFAEIEAAKRRQQLEKSSEKGGLKKIYRCVACGRDYKSESTYNQHLNSKRHKRVMSQIQGATDADSGPESFSDADVLAMRWVEETFEDLPLAESAAEGEGRPVGGPFQTPDRPTGCCNQIIPSQIDKLLLCGTIRQHSDLVLHNGGTRVHRGNWVVARQQRHRMLSSRGNPLAGRYARMLEGTVMDVQDLKRLGKAKKNAHRCTQQAQLKHPSIYGAHFATLAQGLRVDKR